MTNHMSDPDPIEPDDLESPSDHLVDEIDTESDDDFGDETQSNEERTALEGMEQSGFIDPRGEDSDEADESE